jgi:hypothetical protein
MSASRCCAKCKTPGFGCANSSCPCHGVATPSSTRPFPRETVEERLLRDIFEGSD